MTALGTLHLDAGDLEALARVLLPYIEQARQDEGDWYSTVEWAARGFSPTVAAATKKARRMLDKGDPNARRMGSRLYLKGPPKW